jgi:acyl-CoA dehydrogenase family protein 9
MATSIVSSMFLGELATDLLLPYPVMDDEQRELLGVLRDALGRFAADHIDPEAIDKAHAIPDAVLDGLGEMGLFGMLIPEEHGGLELNQTQYVKVGEDLAVFDGSIAAMSGGHSTIGIKALLLFGSDEQKAKYLPRLATGEMKACFALTEPEAGSDAQSLKMTAVKSDDGGYVLNGNKLWITNGGIAELYTVFVRTPDHPREDGRPSISCFVVERGMGVQIGPEEDKLGIRGSSTVPLIFENVVVPAENLIGEPGDGFKIALKILNGGRTGLAGGCLGASRYLLGEAARYTAAREQFGQSIDSFELIQRKLGLMAQDIHALDCMVYLTTGIMDGKRGDVALESAICKIFGTEILWNVVNAAGSSRLASVSASCWPVTMKPIAVRPRRLS